jgi:hypothetical protein
MVLFKFLWKLWKLHQSGEARERLTAIREDISTLRKDTAEIRQGLSEAITVLGREHAKVDAVHNEVTRLQQ